LGFWFGFGFSGFWFLCLAFGTCFAVARHDKRRVSRWPVFHLVSLSLLFACSSHGCFFRFLFADCRQPCGGTSDLPNNCLADVNSVSCSFFADCRLAG
jgi:hypothetical protein